MPLYQLPKSVSGMNDCLYYNPNTKEIIKCSSLPRSSIEFRDVNRLLTVENIDNIKTLRSINSSMIKTLNLEEEAIDWISLLGKHSIKKRCNSLIETYDRLHSTLNDSYRDILMRRYEFTDRFSKGYSNKERKSEYCHASSKTGRVKIKDGYNYLVMNSGAKKEIESKFSGGKIFEIDIVSLEPRVLMKILEKDDVDDVYMHIKSTLGLSGDRRSIKIGIISCIYGGANRTVSKLSGLKNRDIKAIKEYFQLSFLNKRLKKENEALDKIVNCYGRNIYNPTSLINNYIQSSAADCACLAFDSLLNLFDGKKINTIAFIHDSILIDSHPNHFDFISSLENMYEDKMGLRLPIKSKGLL